MILWFSSLLSVLTQKFCEDKSNDGITFHSQISDRPHAPLLNIYVQRELMSTEQIHVVIKLPTHMDSPHRRRKRSTHALIRLILEPVQVESEHFCFSFLDKLSPLWWMPLSHLWIGYRTDCGFPHSSHFQIENNFPSRFAFIVIPISILTHPQPPSCTSSCATLQPCVKLPINRTKSLLTPRFSVSLSLSSSSGNSSRSRLLASFVDLREDVGQRIAKEGKTELGQSYQFSWISSWPAFVVFRGERHLVRKVAGDLEKKGDGKSI